MNIKTNIEDDDVANIDMCDTEASVNLPDEFHDFEDDLLNVNSDIDETVQDADEWVFFEDESEQSDDKDINQPLPPGNEVVISKDVCQWTNKPEKFGIKLFWIATTSCLHRTANLDRL